VNLQFSLDEFWILLTAIGVALNCASIGTHVALRKMSMLGDAMSHSVLLGIIGAFVLTGLTSPIPLFLGALFVAICTGYLTQALSSRTGLSEDASIGVNFTWMFALGVILLSFYADDLHLDQECVLYGELAFAAFHQWTVFGQEVGPVSLWTAFFSGLVLAIFLYLGRRALPCIAFDRNFAISSGVTVHRWDFLLLSFLALVVVSSFESVGAILVIALLSIPAACANLFAKSPGKMLALANAHAIFACIIGFLLARAVNGNIAASIAIVAGLMFIIELLCLSIWKKKYLASGAHTSTTQNVKELF
jgi:manganese/zinc/iron transport system permease protein